MASGILPGRFALIIPRDPIGFCAVCDVQFFADRDVRQHMGSAQHEDGVNRARDAEERRKARLPFMHEDIDPEISAHMKKVGKRMLAEGRMVVKPSERAGFS